MISDVEHSCLCLLTISVYSLEKCLLKSFACFLLLSCRHSLYVLDANPLAEYDLKIFSPIHSLGSVLWCTVFYFLFLIIYLGMQLHFLTLTCETHVWLQLPKYLLMLEKTVGIILFLKARTWLNKWECVHLPLGEKKSWRHLWKINTWKNNPLYSSFKDKEKEIHWDTTYLMGNRAKNKKLINPSKLEL